MSTRHLSEYELRQRIDEREAALADTLHLLIAQCKVVAIDQESLIERANAVTSAAMALRQCKETLAYMEAQL